MKRRAPCVRAEGSFFLLLAALLLTDRQELLPSFLAACAVHELGHLFALRACGGRIALLRLNAAGAEIRLKNAGTLSYPAELLCVLAGPAAGLLLGFLAAYAGAPLLAGLSLGLTVFNLLPARTLDGGQALFLSLSWLFSPDAAARAARAVSLLTVGAMFLCGLLLLPRLGPPLLLTALWLALTEHRCAASCGHRFRGAPPL